MSHYDILLAKKLSGGGSANTNLKLICKTDKCAIGDTISNAVKNCIDNASEHPNYVFYVCMYENDNERFSYIVGRHGTSFIDDTRNHDLQPFASNIREVVSFEATSGKISVIYHNNAYRVGKCDISVYEFNPNNE